MNETLFFQDPVSGKRFRLEPGSTLEEIDSTGEPVRGHTTMATSDDPNSAQRTIEAFNSLVAGQRTKTPHLSRMQCVRLVSRQHPELHAAYCRALPRGGPVIRKQR